MACLDGSELVDDVLAAATRLAGGRDFVLLVASDRRSSLKLLRARGVRMVAVPRLQSTSTDKVAEHGEDVGETAMRDIHLLSFAHHLIGVHRQMHHRPMSTPCLSCLC